MSGQDWRPFIYGGVASVMAEFGTFAIDTTKTRLQIQGQKIDNRHSELKYRGMFHALLRISKEEGIRALYCGLAPAVLRQATYGTMKIGVYYSAKKYLVKNPMEETLLTNIFCGMLAGVVSSSIANPTDVLKIRMQAQNENFSKKNMLQCFVEIYKQEGACGLWRGVIPTAQRAAIIVGVELPVYDVIKRNFIRSKVLTDGVPNHIMYKNCPPYARFTLAIICDVQLQNYLILVQTMDKESSFIAGLAGAVASNPIDVVRTRLMNQRKLKAAVINGVKVEATYASTLDCLIQTVQSEGVFALYKGFIPTWVRLGPWNIIFFVTYEQLKKFY